MSPSSLSALLLLPVLMASPAVGQPGGGALRLTLDDAIALALERSAEVRLAERAVELRGALELQSYAAVAPTLSLSSSASRSLGRAFSQQEGGIVSGTTDLVGAELGAELELFSGFEKTASILRARQEGIAARGWRARVRQDAVFLVTREFVTLWQNRTLEEVGERQLQAQDELLTLVRAAVELGRRPSSDLHQQLASRAEAEVALVDARTEVGRSQIRLQQLLQLDPSQPVEFLGPPREPRGELAPQGDEPAAALIDHALEAREDLRALEAERAAAEHGVLQARSGFWPRLSIRAGYGTNWSSQDHRPIPGTGIAPRRITLTPDDGSSAVTFPVPGTGRDPSLRRTAFVEQLGSRHGGAVMLLLDVPLFDGLETWQQVQRAQAELDQAEILAQQQRAAVTAQVEQALLDRRAARARLGATAARLQAARQAREGTRRRYELGRGTFVEVAQAESDFVSARSAHVRAEHDLLLSAKLVEYQVGSLSTSAGLDAGSTLP